MYVYVYIENILLPKNDYLNIDLPEPRFKGQIQGRIIEGGGVITPV